MGRAKLDMELISKEKSRNITYQKRKKGLMKKASELTTLCGIDTCMIIYGPKQDNDRPIEPETWPTDPNAVKKTINMYKEKDNDSGKRTVDLFDFFKDRKKKIEEEVAKIRRKNLESQYPTWDDQINDLSEIDLREFLDALEKKFQILKTRVEMVKRNGCLIGGSSASGMIDYSYTTSNQNQNQNHYSNYLQRGIELKPLDQVPMHYYHTTHHDHVHQTVQMSQNPMMMLVMNDQDLMQFGGASTSSNNNIGYTTQFKGPLHCDGMLDSVVYNNPRHLMRYYAPSLQPMQASEMHASHGAQYNDFVDDHHKRELWY